jgi:hypothetical protein
MRHPRPRKVVTRAGAALLALAALTPAPAAAATVSATQVQRPDELGGTSQATYLLTAAPGEANRVRVSVDQGHVVFADLGAPMSAGAGCRVDTGLIRCAIAGDDRRIVVDTGDGADTVEIADLQNLVPHVLVSLGAGDDVLTVSSAATVSASGGAGDDHMSTGPGGGTLAGGPGDDRLTGASGRDDLDGGPGADTIRAGKGDDAVTLDGADKLARPCGAGRDTVLGTLVAHALAPRDCEQTIIGSILEFRLHPVAISRYSVSFKAVVATQSPARLQLRDVGGRLLGTASAGNAARRIVFRLTGLGRRRTHRRSPLRVRIVQIAPRAGRGAHFVAVVG